MGLLLYSCDLLNQSLNNSELLLPEWQVGASVIPSQSHEHQVNVNLMYLLPCELIKCLQSLILTLLQREACKYTHIGLE